MQQQTNKANTSKNKRLKSYLFFEPKKQNPFNAKFYKFIILDNNFIHAFNEFKDLKIKGINVGFKIIMFKKCIFYVILVPDFFKNSTTIN